MDYLEADDLVFEVIQQHGTPMFKAAVGSEAFPKTYRAMVGFCVKTNYLKTALFDMVESNNPYAFKALFRCYCDHYLKFMYLFVRFLKEKSDNGGRDYFSYCGAVETRDYLNTVIVAEKLVGNEVVGDLRSAMNAVYPDVSGVSQSELEAASAKFRYRSILRYLSAETPLVSADSPTLAKIVPIFAEYSSFVHGGPWSDRDMYGYGDPAALDKCREQAEIAFMMAASVFLFTSLVLCQEFPEHGKAFVETKRVIDEFSGRTKRKRRRKQSTKAKRRLSDDDIPF